MSRGRRIVRLKLRPLSANAQALLLTWDPGELYREPKQFPVLSSEGLFGNQNPLEVEIGSGSGEYLCHLAGSNPGTNYLGVDVSRRPAEACAALAAARGLANLRVLRTDFKLLSPLMPREGWARVYLHFPDPPQKTADDKHRIFTTAFLDQMNAVLINGGEISVVSDRQDFFFEMLKLAESDTRFQLAYAERYVEGWDFPVRSRFHEFWERKGGCPFGFTLRKGTAL